MESTSVARMRFAAMPMMMYHRVGLMDIVLNFGLERVKVECLRPLYTRPRLG
jgi:hypothetical protein